MGKIPPKILSKILADPYYKVCCRKNKDCGGRITFEHVFIYAGRQIQEIWAIIPLCEYHHDVGAYQDKGDLRKDINQWIALSRAKPWDLSRYPRANFTQMKSYLVGRYGKYHPISSKTDPQQDFFD